MAFRRWLIIIAMLLLNASSEAAPDNPAARLREARTLRCTFTAVAITWIKSGRRTQLQTTDHTSIDYDSLDLVKGTGRIIGNGGAGELSVWVEQAVGSLWMLQRTESGNVFMTTVFPMYAAGSNEFVALAARHSMTDQTASGEETYGTCKILQ